MFNKLRLKSALFEYKKHFIQTKWVDKKYKWESIKCFQDNWDVKSEDFSGMLIKAMSKTENLLSSGNNLYIKMITEFAKVAQEEVRSMFIELFDESKDVCDRIDNFNQKSKILLERYGNGEEQDYQYENAISIYLWLRYPDKYYIYNFNEVKEVSTKLESDYIFKDGAYADNIRNFLSFYNEICAELQQDVELNNILSKRG